MAQKKTSGGTTGRYVLRHIRRAPGRSILCLALAGVFMLGLMLVQVSVLRSEAELDHLYTTITVNMEVTKARLLEFGKDGYIYSKTVDMLMRTGFISEHYLEGKNATIYIFPINDLGEAIDSERFLRSDQILYGTENPENFFEQWGIPGEITYFNGWNASMFVPTQETGANGFYPVVVSQELYDSFELLPESLLKVGIRANDSEVRSSTLTVVGTHPGDQTLLLLPLEKLDHLPGVDLKYSRVILTIDPTQNRQLENFQQQAAKIIEQGGKIDLTAIYWDQELRQAIAPMEQVISFMKALYPVTVLLSLLVAAGISILLSLLSAKETAILRVLGNSKLRCRATLCLQTVLVCILGLIIGHLGAVTMAHALLPLEAATGLTLPALGRAGLYLLSATVGAMVASTTMTAKNPLELLQVKE